MAKKILIVEDNSSIAEMLRTQVQKAGYEAVIALDAMLGTRECVRLRPDLVILDLMLPAGGGVSVLRSLRRSLFTKQTPVIVLTGTQDPAMRKQVLEFGVNIFLQKPHDPDELMALIAKLLSVEEKTNASAPNP